MIPVIFSPEQLDLVARIVSTRPYAEVQPVMDTIRAAVDAYNKTIVAARPAE